MASTYAREKSTSPNPPKGYVDVAMNENVKTPDIDLSAMSPPLRSPSLARRQLAAEQIRELGSQRGASCEGGEHNRGEGREMTRAFTVMRFPL